MNAVLAVTFAALLGAFVQSLMLAFRERETWPPRRVVGSVASLEDTF